MKALERTDVDNGKRQEGKAPQEMPWRHRSPFMASREDLKRLADAEKTQGGIK